MPVKKRTIKKVVRQKKPSGWLKFWASREALFVTTMICIFLIGLTLGLAISACLETKQDIRSLEKAIRLVGNTDNLTVEAAKRVSPSVVSIVISKDLKKLSNLTGPDVFPFDDYFEFGWPDDLEESPDGKQKVGVGTGFVVNSQKGYVLTNKHVVSDAEAEYTVLSHDGQVFAAQVVDTDPFNDLAVIQIDSQGKLPPVKLGDSEKIAIGETVIAIGYTLGEYKNTVTKGVVSGIDRRVVAGGPEYSEVIEAAIQTDAAINPGNSGGPLVNLHGQVIGINTAVNRNGQLLGFAIPVNVAKEVVASIDQHGRIIRPWLGVRYRSITRDLAKAWQLPVDYGALLVAGSEGQPAIFPASPAAQAGLAPGDIIIELEGQKITPDHPLGEMVKKQQFGNQINLNIVRDGQIMRIRARLGEYGQSVE